MLSNENSLTSCPTILKIKLVYLLPYLKYQPPSNNHAQKNHGLRWLRNKWYNCVDPKSSTTSRRQLLGLSWPIQSGKRILQKADFTFGNHCRRFTLPTNTTVLGAILLPNHQLQLRRSKIAEWTRPAGGKELQETDLWRLAQGSWPSRGRTRTCHDQSVV